MSHRHRLKRDLRTKIYLQIAIGLENVPIGLSLIPVVDVIKLFWRKSRFPQN